MYIFHSLCTRMVFVCIQAFHFYVFLLSAHGVEARICLFRLIARIAIFLTPSNLNFTSIFRIYSLHNHTEFLSWKLISFIDWINDFHWIHSSQSKLRTSFEHCTRRHIPSDPIAGQIIKMDSFFRLTFVIILCCKYGLFFFFKTFLIWFIIYNTPFFWFSFHSYQCSRSCPDETWTKYDANWTAEDGKR